MAAPWFLLGRALLLRRMFARDLEEVLQNLVAVLRGDALRMELHAMDRQALVAQPHDDLAGLGRDLELGRQAGPVDDQRMVTRRLERRGHVLEHPLAPVADPPPV